MTRLALLLFAVLFVTSFTHTPQVLAQDTDGGEPFAVEPHRVVIQVNGIVCSFCAERAQLYQYYNVSYRHLRRPICRASRDGT